MVGTLRTVPSTGAGREDLAGEEKRGEMLEGRVARPGEAAGRCAGRPRVVQIFFFLLVLQTVSLHIGNVNMDCVTLCVMNTLGVSSKALCLESCGDRKLLQTATHKREGGTINNRYALSGLTECFLTLLNVH